MSIATKLAVVVCAILGVSGCDDTTGVQLAIHADVAADHVSITATSASGSVTRVEAAPGGSDWTLQLVATFDPNIGTVTFTATPMRGGATVATCAAASRDVTPHRVVDLTLACTPVVTGGDGDGGSGDLGATDLAASGYFAAVLADLPIGYYHLGEATGTRAAATTGLSGTYGGMVARHQPSLLDDAAALVDGASGFGGGSAVAANTVRAAGAALAPKTALSVELWLQAGSSNEGGLALQYDYGGAKIVPVYSLTMTQNHLVFYVHAGGKTTASTITSVGTIAPNTAHYVVGTYDETAQSMSLWIDGQLDQTLAGNSGDLVHGDATTSGLGIGGAFNDGSGAVAWNGIIDEVAIYATALDQAEVAAHYLAGK